MTAGPPLAFPGSRTLAGWWRQLAPLHPEALRVGHLLLHRVEAMTRCHRPYRPGAFPLVLLRALALEPAGRPHPPGAPSNNHAGEAPGEGQLRRLDVCLRLGRPLLLQALQSLARQGLVQGGPQTGWAPAPAGRQALERGEVPRDCYERRTFYFLEREPAGGGARPAPAFLPLRSEAGLPWAAGDDWGFDVEVLRACLGRPPEWKRRRTFPAEVADVLPADPAAADFPAWQRVPLDRPEHLAAVLALVPGAGGPRLVGFAFRPEGWALDLEEPVLALDEGWAEDLPEVRVDPGPGAWQAAWRQWCGQRALPAAEAEACGLEPAGVLLRVRPGARLLERLRVARSDALKGEAWLLAGTGRLRAAARVEVLDAEGP
jgi:hypothetical protein